MLLKAVVFFKNEKTKTHGDLLAVARHCARRREKSKVNPPIVALLPVFEVQNCYVAVYVGDKTDLVFKSPRRRGIEVSTANNDRRQTRIRTDS